MEVMRHTALTYLGYRLWYRIVTFLEHWYVRSMRRYWHWFINWLERIDYYLAWRITLKNIFKPLYGDYSIIGRTLGFIFRSLRVLFASAIYAVLFAAALALYLIWILIPIAVAYKIIGG